MATRDPFAFLDDETPQRKTLLLLLALLKKQGGEVELELSDLTSIEDGASFHKYPSDTGTRLVLRFARKGAEAYFLSETPSTPEKSRLTAPARTPRPSQGEEASSPSRHAIHDDIALAMREEEMATRAESHRREEMRKARAEAGVMPWTTRQ